MKFFYMIVICLGLNGSFLEASSDNENFALYKEVVQKIKEEAINTIDEKKLMEGCLDGAINVVDKSGNYYNEQEFEHLFSTSTLTARSGMHIVQHDGHIVIKSVLLNSPAAKAGLKSGDEILKIGDMNSRHMDREDAIIALRGYPNTKIKLSILKVGTQKPIDITLTRKIIDENKVLSKAIDNHLLYIKIIAFEAETLKNILTDIEALYDEPKAGMILDLRDNLGGVLSSGLALASLFLPDESVLINVKSRKKEDKKQYKNTPLDFEGSDVVGQIKKMPYLKNIPIVVLVNQDSMGSAEIVAAVLQEYNRATIVGQPTVGKDTFATIFSLGNQKIGMKLATARWTTPKGKSIWPSGVIPNVEVDEETQDEDPSLQMALTVLTKQ
ncbi:MAG: S41 family peptidase [Sulfurospirillaceae bacterium]|nr:S41 family peptidase [Sulfurospirillaceae bacterium]MDD2827225.1 S41 family peptidase [Sulfurospirillaceae bacterium]